MSIQINYEKSSIKKSISNTILISVPPCNFIDPVEEKFSKFFSETNKKIRLIYLSSTGVYGDHKGAWVYENSKLKPKTELGKWRLRAEKNWLSFAKLNNLPISILRLSGIYGPNRSTFDRIQDKSFKIVRSPNLLFSRIHIDDITNIIVTFLEKKNINGVYNLSDNMPATSESLYLETFKLLRLNFLIVLKKILFSTPFQPICITPTFFPSDMTTGIQSAVLTTSFKFLVSVIKASASYVPFLSISKTISL